LTNLKDVEAEEIIFKMVRGRPIQENDFKKQKNHFGLDEITSYAKMEYGELNDKDPDKETINKEYEKLMKDIRELKEERRKLLATIGLNITNNVNIMDESYSKKLSKKQKERINELEKINIEIEHKKKLKETKEKKISKLQQCKDEHIIELDLRAKRIFNIIKQTCRNIFE
jgi:hypothetical protein